MDRRHVALVFALAAGCRTTEPGTTALNAAATVSSADETPLPDYEPAHLIIPVVTRAKAERKVASAFATKPSADRIKKAGASLTEASPRYFATIFGFQSTGLLNLPRYTHSWTVFSEFDGSDLATASASAFAISWDAADGAIGVGSGGIERGHNYSYEETLDLAATMPVAIRRSTSIEITVDFYNQAIDRANYLTDNEGNGVVLYRGVDDMSSRRKIVERVPGGHSNCIHALTDLLTYPDGSLHGTLLKHGYAASDAAFEWYMESPNRIGTSAAADAEVAKRLGF